MSVKLSKIISDTEEMDECKLEEYIMEAAEDREITIYTETSGALNKRLVPEISQ
jgi:hypothetical protein